MAIVHLHGDLQNYGGPFVFDVATPGEAVRALCMQLKGFRRRIAEGHFRIFRKRGEIECDIELDAFQTRLRSYHELHIAPVVAGSGKGVGKVILGVAVVAAAFAFAPAVVGALGPTMGIGADAFSIAGFGVSFAQIAGFGAFMILGGVTQLLSPAPPGQQLPQEVANPGGLFSGPANVVEQGSAIPLVYGRFICGSVTISSALDAEAVPVGTIE